PSSGSKDLVFLTQYPQPFLVQCKACLWKQHWSYWRNLQYNAIRFAITVLAAAILGVVFFRKGEKIVKLEDLLSKLGTFHSAVVFFRALNQNAVHPLVALENTIFYRKRADGMYLLLPYALAQSNYFGRKLGESAGVDSSIFTKAWVDSVGSEGLKDHSAIDRWQSQAATADSDFFNRLRVMEQTTDAEKAMVVFEFLDLKCKNKIRAFVDRLIERHMAMKADTKSTDCSYASKDSQEETRDARDMLSAAI
nr:AAA+ ATPase domain-containing protein [Tanacetum cinerariifolium]